MRPRLLLPLLALATACAPAQYIYSTDPVDHRGDPLPLTRATALQFEDGSRLRLGAGESLRLEDGRFVTDQGAWSTTQVAELHWTDLQGRPDRIRILTPDDLVDEEDPPRITRIRLVDGEWIDLDALPRASAFFAPNGLGLEIRGDNLEREVDLQDIERIELHQGNLLDSTVRNWKFWVMTGAATVVTIWVTQQTDEDGLAVE